MQTGYELFLHEMSDMLDAERRLVEALHRLEEDSSYPQLKQAFADHGRQTEGHVERLEQCFELLDAEPKPTQCAGIRGIIQEKESFMEENPESDILDTFHVGAGIKTENYEICAYQALINMAEALGQSKAARLLNANLKEENAALKKLQGFEKKIRPSRMHEDEEEAVPAARRRAAGPGLRGSRQRAARPRRAA